MDVKAKKHFLCRLGIHNWMSEKDGFPIARNDDLIFGLHDWVCIRCGKAWNEKSDYLKDRDEILQRVRDFKKK